MYELGRGGLDIPPQTPVFIPDINLGSQHFAYLGNADEWLSPSTRQRTKTKKKKSSKHRSTKTRNKSKKTKIGAYILQLIGLLCLILAAIKSFEPLTGVGFTLIMIGYNNKKFRNGLVDDLLKGKKKRKKTKDGDGDRKKERRKEKKEVELLEFESDFEGT